MLGNQNSESEYRLYAVFVFRLYAYSGSRLMLDPDPDFFCYFCANDFVDPNLNFFDQKVKEF